MNLDKQRIFAHEFTAKLVQALSAECPAMAPSIFGLLAETVGVDRLKAELFAGGHRASAGTECPDLARVLHHSGGIISSWKKEKAKTKT